MASHVIQNRLLVVSVEDDGRVGRRSPLLRQIPVSDKDITRSREAMISQDDRFCAAATGYCIVKETGLAGGHSPNLKDLAEREGHC